MLRRCCAVLTTEARERERERIAIVVKVRMLRVKERVLLSYDSDTAQ